MNNLHIFTFIKNEEHLIEAFINYHSMIADEITIIDNGSTDNTLNIIGPYLKHKQIKLIINTSHFKNKGAICRAEMLKSTNDILIPLDADEFLLYDDNSTTIDDPRLIRQILCNLPLNQKYKINNIYSKIPTFFDGFDVVSNAYDIEHQDLPKLFCSTKGFKNISCGFHSIEMEHKTKPLDINISYAHFHFYSHQRWLKSSIQKLEARLGKNYKLDDIIKLASNRGHSYHIALQMLYYLGTNRWHKLKPKKFFNFVSIPLRT